jgi:hypothetical protein
MSRKHMVGMANKSAALLCLWTLVNDSKHNEASFDDFDGFVALMSRSDA